MCCITLCSVMLIKTMFGISFKLDILCNTKYFSEPIALKSKLKFCHTVQSARGGFGLLSPSETKLKAPPPN